MTKAKNITKEEILEFHRKFYIDHGILKSRINHRTRKMGDIVGYIESDGYRSVKVSGRRFKAHRIIWCMYYGSEPRGFIDHIDKDKSNNRIENLRIATNQVNQRNCKKRVNNTSGITGVTWYKIGQKWGASIKVDNKTINLGTYTTKFAAAYARHIAELTHGFTNN